MSDTDSDTDTNDILVFVEREFLGPQFALDLSELQKWPELGNVRDPATLQAIVTRWMGPLPRDVESLTKARLTQFLDMLHGLDDSLYQDLKVMLFEVLIQCLTATHTFKVELHRRGFHQIFIKRYVALEVTETTWLDFSMASIPNQYVRLISTFCELGCDTNIYRHIVSCEPLVPRLVLLNELHRRGYINAQLLPSSDISLSHEFKHFTIHAWFRVTNADEDLLLFRIGSAASNLTVRLVDNQQFMVEVVSNGRMHFTFNHILEVNSGYTHFVLTYDSLTNLNLYVNGEYLESIPCPQIHKHLATWNRFRIGASHEMLVTNVAVLATALSYEWVSLLYNLGMQYQWDFHDFSEHTLASVIDLLSPSDLAKLALRVNEIRKTPFSLDRKPLVAFLAKRRIRQREIAFHLSDLQPTSSPLTVNAALYSIGGPALILKFLEDSLHDDILVYHVVQLLFEVLQDWRMAREFDNINGYGILSILLTHYKQSANPKLVFEIPESASTSLLRMVLTHCGYDFANEYELMIVNTNAYRALVMDFELFSGDASNLSLLLHHILVLSSGKYAAFNNGEFTRVRLLKKLIQFLKTPSFLGRQLSDDSINQLQSTLNFIIRADTSVEIIRSVSLFVIYSLYHAPLPFYGVLILRLLTLVLADPSSSIKVLKKFSRGITIHWILLLFNYKGPDARDVTQCGLTLLTKLLKTLGSHIIKRFFQVNFGLDILTHFLRHWWLDDSILAQIFLASFGIEVSLQSYTLTSVFDLQNLFVHLVMPDFLLLLNNLVLNSMYEVAADHGKILSATSSPRRGTQLMESSLNALHLINQYADLIKTGLNNKALASFYTHKDWLEGMLELVGHLRMSLTWALDPAFGATYEKVVAVLTDVFLSKLLVVNELFAILDVLSDFTKTVMLEIVFPRLFKHINEFLGVSNFIFNQKDFLNGTSELLAYYYTNFVARDFYISLEAIDLFLTCSLSVLEASPSPTSKVRKCLGRAIIIQLLETSDSDPDRVNEVAKSLLYRQMTVLDKTVLDTKKLAVVVDILAATLFNEDLSHYDHILNFLRACFMTREEEACSHDEPLLFLVVMTKNDDETIRAIHRIPTYKYFYTRNYAIHMGKFKNNTTLHVIDMIKVMVTNGGKLGHMNNIYIKSFERDCDQLRVSIVSGELAKFNRAIQDHQENITFFTSSYNLLKSEIERVLGRSGERSYVLDFIEGVDRMRRRLIEEDKLAELEQPSFNITIPVKQSETVTSDVDDFAIEGINTLGITDRRDTSAEDDDEDFEMVEEPNDDKNRKVVRSLYMGDRIEAIWNISQINGLVPVESLMILGTGFLYLIENYFHCSDGNVIDAKDAPTHQRDPYLELISSQASLFLKTDTHRTKAWGLNKLSCISKRQFLLRDIAIEMFFDDGASILITCHTCRLRDIIYNKLQPYASGKGLDHDLAQLLQTSTQSPDLTFASKFTLAFLLPKASYLEATRKWKNGEMSNFYYLMIINTFAGRTFNDLTQYPVFPWVIADYTSPKLDLSDPKTFRDLSKPMGAQTAQRASQFKERYEALDSLQDPTAPPFHYGTHYSSAMIVTSFLIRLKPYVQSYLILQGGKFDHADRLFNSIEKAWVLASRDNTTDVRELTPEFFFLPEFLVNTNNFELGTMQSGKVSHDVELPPWAHGDPKIFIAKNREALELPYVSSQLHLWIDLIFGIKQNGHEAVLALNIFHHLSYNGAINLDNINDEVEKRAVIGMINNFGQTPLKVFHRPHPKKDVLNVASYYLTLVDKGADPVLTFESKLGQPIVKLERSSKTRKWVGRPQCISCEDDLLIRRANTSYGSLVVNTLTLLNLHLCEITSLVQLGSRIFATGAHDGLIQVWKCSLKPQVLLQFQALLRGHTKPVINLINCKTFKFCLSVDADGNVILWDTTRYKYMRTIRHAIGSGHVMCAISNDTGNIAVVYTGKYANTITVYTLNGEQILSHKLKSSRVTNVTFGSVNDQSTSVLKQVEASHAYWAHDIVAVSYAQPRVTDLFLIVPDDKFSLGDLDSVVWGDQIHGDVTALEVFKFSNVHDDKIIRGHLDLVIGDSTGRVYTLTHYS